MSGVDENSENEQRPPKIIQTTFDDFHELVKGMGARVLDDEMHKKIVDDLMVYDPKRKARVQSRFCSFHLAGFDLHGISTAPLGPRYQPDPLPPGTSLTKYVSGDARYDLASSSINVVSIRVVKVGPGYTYPVDVYGKVIARDEIDYKCVHLFNCERNDAQTINEKDMLALTGPYRALVTTGHMYFEFDLKIKGKGSPDDDAQFSQGVIPYFCNPYHKRIKFQLPSFHSTVKLVLQHVDFSVAASLEVSVVNQEPSDPLVPFDGKITAGTTRNYKHHMLLYDSSVRSRVLVSENGCLALNRNLVAVNGYVEDPALVEDGKLVVHVCFLDASCEIEDKDKMDTEDEDDDDDEEEEEEEEDDVDDEEEEEDEEDREEDPKNVVTLKYPLRETVWEQGHLKLKVKVNWTAVLGKPKGTDFFFRYCCLPVGCEPNYRDGGFF